MNNKFNNNFYRPFINDFIKARSLVTDATTTSSASSLNSTCTGKSFNNQLIAKVGYFGQNSYNLIEYFLTKPLISQPASLYVTGNQLNFGNMGCQGIITVVPPNITDVQAAVYVRPNNSIIYGQIVPVAEISSSITLTAYSSSTVYFITTTSTITYTLPTVSDTIALVAGYNIKFIAAVNSAVSTVKVVNTTGSPYFYGKSTNYNNSTNVPIITTILTATFSFNFTSSSVAGDSLSLIFDGTNWYSEIICVNGGIS